MYECVWWCTLPFSSRYSRDFRTPPSSAPALRDWTVCEAPFSCLPPRSPPLLLSLGPPPWLSLRPPPWLSLRPPRPPPPAWLSLRPPRPPPPGACDPWLPSPC